MKILISQILFLSIAISLHSQEANDSDLFQTILQKDYALFEFGFNQCNTDSLAKYVSNDFVFYHDQAGITPTKEVFITSVRDGLCNLPYQAIRELDEISMEVFPLYNNGELYGAIQSATHSFFALEGDKPKEKTSEARFTHVWILEENGWKLRSVLSYDHH